MLYTDIASGPTSGGENNKGIYLSIFGKNFGASLSSLKVYINDAEVDNYRYLGSSKGRADIQQITVQVGALGNAPANKPLPVKVVVNGAASNTDQTFTVNPGTIHFVDNLNGVDTATTNSGGSFNAPFKTVQKNAGKKLDFATDPASLAGAWGRVRAGDFIVMRGHGLPYTDLGFDTYFLRALNKSGSAPGASPACAGCTGSGPITIMGYPNEDVFINNAYDPAGKSNGAISSASNARLQEDKGSWITIAGLRIEGGNDDGVINTQLGGSHWRVVNNDLSAATAVGNLNALAGGIVGSGLGQFWVGNHVHDIYQGPKGNSPLQNHGIYVGDDPDLAGNASYEIAYNDIENIYGGNGFQVHVGAGVTGVANNINLHHNLIHEIGKHGINIADGAQNNIAVWNNVVYNTTYAGIRMGGTSFLRGLKLYNNTFYNTCTSGTTDRDSAANFAALTNELVPAANQLDIRNNIFVPALKTRYVIDVNGGFAGNIGSVTHNLWFGGTDTNPATTFSSNSVQSDPGFVAVPSNLRLVAGGGAIDKGTSIVSAVVTDDYDLVGPRPKGAGFDIGAFER